MAVGKAFALLLFVSSLDVGRYIGSSRDKDVLGLGGLVRARAVSRHACVFRLFEIENY
jgi:hypothetical protein